jgi:hypothetical protein
MPKFGHSNLGAIVNLELGEVLVGYATNGGDEQIMIPPFENRQLIAARPLNRPPLLNQGKDPGASNSQDLLRKILSYLT